MEANHIEDLYTRYKPLLFSIAYKMVGTVSEAEDIVQDTFLTFFQQDLYAIQNEKAYLCKIATNRALDLLKSSRKKREVYVGPWLPEPYLKGNGEDLLNQYLDDEQLSFTYLFMMEKLAPNERSVFILKEGYSFKYSEIAQILDKTEANCRKLLERAKQKIRSKTYETTLNNGKNRDITQSFIKAFQEGKMNEVIKLMSEDVILYSDGGGIVKAAIKPIYQRDRVLAFLLGVASKLPQDFVFEQAEINGQIGLVNRVNHQTHSVICFQVDNEVMDKIYIVMNPEKLAHIK
ncbi:RNA polymerase sigma-70 factor [Metabacillus malikii]|uniref:RNA polymerase sigma-70 factor (ECF subfamily) n=1 Tax=Metabacillus malikii TaxID=1504265 RepID=A0ABT9ZHD5_9BACI|nr:RNA polymerase sigma-70 factor [Metabacillus malikii]MDQ0231699.1 RNA polymerase sigma-70 factor (ECF subfamily) [Metabacillus malikii]